MPDKPTDSLLRINHDLYVRLREHCDRFGTRFLEFAEDALENAMLNEIGNNGLEQEIEVLRRKADQYDYAFNRGFKEGFAYLYLMLNGASLSAEAEDNLSIARKFPAATPNGEQLKLF
ncbi:MAG: hypothetical protein MUC57_09750 [Desulfobacterales bacterium]|jgi:hypothetical protein|nr:hypothetical protein [Desulfobacterales bacterium]